MTNNTELIERLAREAVFDQWWKKNEKQYSSDALHMSEYHMASVVWNAAIAQSKKPVHNSATCTDT